MTPDSRDTTAVARIEYTGGVALFTSAQERRLWRWALLVLAAIYATLGLAGTLNELVRNERLIGNSMVVAFFLLIGAIVWSGLRKRPGPYEIWVGLGITAVYGMAFFRMGASPAHRTHLIEYGLLAVLIYQALLERQRNGGGVSRPAVLAIGATILLGCLDEGIQWLLPNRVFDPVDIGFNAGAALAAVGASLALASARRWGGRLWSTLRRHL